MLSSPFNVHRMVAQLPVDQRPPSWLVTAANPFEAFATAQATACGWGRMLRRDKESVPAPKGLERHTEEVWRQYAGNYDLRIEYLRLEIEAIVLRFGIDFGELKVSARKPRAARNVQTKLPEGVGLQGADEADVVSLWNDLLKVNDTTGEMTDAVADRVRVGLFGLSNEGNSERRVAEASLRELTSAEKVRGALSTFKLRLDLLAISTDVEFGSDMGSM